MKLCVLLWLVTCAAAQTVTFKVWDAVNQKELFELRNGGRINGFRAQSLSIEASVEGLSSRVFFFLDGQLVRREFSAPYFMFGDVGVNPIAGAIAPGNRKLEARAFRGPNLIGSATITFSVDTIDGESPKQQQPAPVPATPAPAPKPVAKSTPAPVSKPAPAPPTPATPAPVTAAVTPAPATTTTGAPPPGVVRCVQERKGIVTAQFENFANRADGWTVGTDPSAFNGKFMTWTKDDFFAGPFDQGFSTLKFEISTPGIYLFQWRTGYTGNIATEENDSFIRINVGANSWAADNLTSTRFYARGVKDGKPNVNRPAGTSGDGFFKAYRTGRQHWSWGTWTGDYQDMNIYARFPKNGTFSLNVAGRSTGHKIDKIMLLNVADVDFNEFPISSYDLNQARKRPPISCEEN